ncbi:hypothetical protein AB0B04_19285 [Streptomyces xinghaiensis]|nr:MULTISPECIES: hypothetical protein [Streptomyces]
MVTTLLPGRARIGILGGPRTGKTTVARRIASEVETALKVAGR